MTTRYTYQTTITVTVDMADEGETYDGEPQHWDSPGAQEESAREWAEQAMPLTETYAEDFVTVDAPPLKLVPASAPEPAPDEITRLHLMLQGAWALLPPEDGERLGIKQEMLDCKRPECGHKPEPAPAPTERETARLMTCGQHPTLGHVGAAACNRELPPEELYRCADCRTAFCRDCLRRHFADEKPEARERMRKAEEMALAEDDRACHTGERG